MTTKVVIRGLSVKRLRKERGISRKQLARRVGSTREAITAIESQDDCRISLDLAQRLAGALHGDMSFFRVPQSQVGLLIDPPIDLWKNSRDGPFEPTSRDCPVKVLLHTASIAPSIIRPNHEHQVRLDLLLGSRHSLESHALQAQARVLQLGVKIDTFGAVPLQASRTWTAGGGGDGGALHYQMVHGDIDITPHVWREPSLSITLTYKYHEDVFYESTRHGLDIEAIDENDLIHDLIEQKWIRRLPTGVHHRLLGGGDAEYETNLHLATDIVLPKSREIACQTWRDLAYMIDRHIRSHLTEQSPFDATPWVPVGSEGSDDDLLLHRLADDLHRRPSLEAHSRDHVQISIFQTSDFVRDAGLNNRSAISLFGFVTPRRADVVFNLGLAHLHTGGTDSDLRIREADLSRIDGIRLSDADVAFWRIEREEPKGNWVHRNKYDVQLFENLEQSSRQCIIGGLFVTSEPTLTPTWISLDVFERTLRKNPEWLWTALNEVVLRCIRGYDYGRDDVIVVNLCTRESHICDEFSLLYGYEYPGVQTVSLNEEGQVNVANGQTERRIRSAIVLAPIDSYRTVIDGTIRDLVTRLSCRSLAVISLFSRGERMDPPEAPEYDYDSIALLRLKSSVGKRNRPAPTGDVEHLLEMYDILARRPWLRPEKSHTDLLRGT